MNKESLRMFLWVALISVAFFLYTHWEQKNLRQVDKNTVTYSESEKIDNTDIPQVSVKPEKKSQQQVIPKTQKSIPEERLINVKTDVFDLNIDLQGGDIVSLTLPKYPEEITDKSKGYQLLDNKVNEKFYVVQSGLLSEQGPDSRELGRALFTVNNKTFKLHQGDENLTVDLFYTTPNNVEIIKRFNFKKDSYLINVEYIVNNKSSQQYDASFYGRIKRTNTAKSSGFMGMRTYTGAAINTPDKAYYKISFDDMNKESFSQNIPGGWAAMIEHYFTTAWIPNPDSKHTYSSEKLADDVFGIRFVSNAVSVMPGETKTVSGRLYAGPEITDTLKEISPGLDLTVDYGVLWPICKPIFWVLKTMHQFVGNWGIAIILTTLVIKLLFFKLSASSYKSMARMRKLQPKIESLKQRYGEDKQGFGQAVMQLYKTEKVNPLGGCLPILVQIPVFIALYYVLLESVELRHAPFFLWINDLSAKDPFYVLPIIMGLSMIVQQKLSPAPPDPVQAKVMMVMPIVFTFLFIQFPAGLVLYWVVNNILSITQQWVITKSVEK